MTPSLTAIPSQVWRTTHPIPAASDHTHSLTIDNTVGGRAHLNVPPGAVVNFAIKV
ncbi:hypothetical protein [Methylobacterium sp. Leaf118]|uniref:hypothetical protein n=1 Tax=Methylobacterium sp. Leaf118 TaxID=2876562 RepID=UPI001E49E186|nr:hypothetical protein [Methylobacterium sp. Leaf118]